MHKHLSIFFILIACVSFSACNIPKVTDCGGNGGIIVDKELYNNISINVGDTLIIDLLGEPPVFRHADNFPFSITGISNTNSDVVSMTIDPNSNSTELLIIIGISTGTSTITLMAEDECDAGFNQKFKKIHLEVY